MEQKDSDDDSDLDIIDVDLSIDVNKMEASQVCVYKLYDLIMFAIMNKALLFNNRYLELQNIFLSISKAIIFIYKRPIL